MSCARITVCFAVGTLQTPSTGPFSSLDQIEQWSGSSWTALAPGSFAGTRRTDLTGVSYAGPKFCMAVGWAQTFSTTYAVYYLYNGTHWAQEPMLHNLALPGFGQQFLGVSCPSSKACVAVGAKGDGPLAARWNGSPGRSPARRSTLARSAPGHSSTACPARPPPCAWRSASMTIRRWPTGSRIRNGCWRTPRT